MIYIVFGVNAEICAIVWDLMEYMNVVTEGDQKEHMMRALFFLITYKNENNLAAMLGGIDEKTLQKWVHKFVQSLSDLEAVVVSDIIS